MATKLKVLSSKDEVFILFGEWRDKLNGNTYHDAEVMINKESYEIPYKYGNPGDYQAVQEALEAAGYRVRMNNKDWHKPYRAVGTRTVDKLKKELFK